MARICRLASPETAPWTGHGPRCGHEALTCRQMPPQVRRGEEEWDRVNSRERGRLDACLPRFGLATPSDILRAWTGPGQAGEEKELEFAPPGEKASGSTWSI
jgi:hypothetical protein